jgi:hypothetical protein
MLAACEAATAHRPPAQVHLERFGSYAGTGPASGFMVVLERSVDILPAENGGDSYRVSRAQHG